MNTVKLAVNLQNFARVRLQLKIAFIIRPYDINGFGSMSKTRCRNLYSFSFQFSIN